MSNDEKVLSMLDQIVERLDRIEAKVDSGFHDTRAEIVEVVEALGEKIDSLEHTIKDVENVTAQNAFDVQLMKHRA